MNFNDVCITKARKLLGTSKEPFGIEKERWWTEDVQKTVKLKKIAFVEWKRCSPTKIDEKHQLKQQYKSCKKSAARTVAQAQAQSKEGLYESIETPEGAQRLYKIAASRRNHAKGIVAPKNIEDEDGSLLTQDKAICDR